MSRTLGNLAAVAASIGLWGCVSNEEHHPSQTRRFCPIVTVYAGSSSPTAEGSRREELLWMDCRVKISEEGYDFGWINDRGAFIVTATGRQGILEVMGGEKMAFAIRRIGAPDEIYPLQDHGTCTLEGTPLPASKALLPRKLSRDYSPRVSLAFILPNDRTVTVDVTALPPNGFTLEED